MHFVLGHIQFLAPAQMPTAPLEARGGGWKTGVKPLLYALVLLERVRNVGRSCGAGVLMNSLCEFMLSHLMNSLREFMLSRLPSRSRRLQSY